jgi:ankyrin repeat protein
MHCVTSQRNCLDAMQYLKDKGFDISAANAIGRTPMHYAAVSGNVEAVQWLKERGADVKPADEQWDTPMHAAAMYNHIEVVRYLQVAGGVDINIPNEKTGVTPLLAAVRVCKEETVKFLRNSGADLRAFDIDGGMAIHHVAAQDQIATQIAIVKYLIQLMEDVNVVDFEGATPMHWATGFGRTELVKFLQGLGADISAKANDGQTPLHWAAANGHVDVARELKNAGVDLGLRTKDGKTAAGLARREGYWKLAIELVPPLTSFLTRFVQ